MLLTDRQDGTLGWVRSMPIDDLTRNALALVKAGESMGTPLVLTCSLEDRAQGPLVHELSDVAGEHDGRIKRQGVVNALDDPAYQAAVEATGRTNLIVAARGTPVTRTSVTHDQNAPPISKGHRP